MKSTYLIDYIAYDSKGNIIKAGPIKVKNCLSKLEAKCKLDTYLKKANPHIYKLTINSCIHDNLGFDSLSFFNDMFK